MRVFAVAVFAICASLWAGTAFAEMPPLHTLEITYRIVEPCDVEVTTGKAVLSWNDCGAYSLVMVDYEDYGHPLAVLFYTGTPDFSTLDDHAYSTFMCSNCKKWQPDPFCMICDDCDWRCYKYDYMWQCNLIKVKSYLPACMHVEIVDVQ